MWAVDTWVNRPHKNRLKWKLDGQKLVETTGEVDYTEKEKKWKGKDKIMAQSKKELWKQINDWKKEKTDRVILQVPKGYKDKWKGLATLEGKSLTRWIFDKIEGEQNK